jgi:hypothetical protein
LAAGTTFLEFSLAGTAAGGSFLEVVGDTQEVRRGSVVTGIVGVGGALVGMSGLVEVPRETSGDLEGSLGRVSIMGAIGKGSRSWDMHSRSGVGLGLETHDASSLDMERGVVGVVGCCGSA